MSFAAGALVLALSLLVDPIHPAWASWPVRSILAVAAGLILAWLPSLRPVRRALARAVFDSGNRAFHLALFAAGAGISTAITLAVFDGLPRLDDGVASIFQARIFALGRVTLPLPPEATFFETYFVLGNKAGLGHWCGMYPPGWPLLLVPGVWLGATWTVNPLLHGALCVAIAWLGAEVYGRRAGRLAGALGLASPILAVLGGEQMSHTATALFLCLCAWAACRLVRTGQTRYGGLAGLAWGGAFLCRPLTAVVVGAGIALLPLVEWRRTFAAWRGVLLAAALAIAAAGALAAFQQATTGDWRTPGHVIGMGRNGRMGFVRFDSKRAHTPALGWEHTLKRLRNVNRHLQGWPIPFYLLALAPFLAGRARGREFWLLAPSVGLLAAFSAFWHLERYYPSRYVSEAMPMLLVLAAGALTGMAGRRAGPPSPEEPGLPWPAWAAPVLSSGLLFMAVAGAPNLLSQFHDNYGDIESVLPRVVKIHGIANAVLFMDEVGQGTDQINPRNRYYATGFLRNDLELRGEVIYARNQREENVRLMRLYPGRRYYVYRFNRKTSRAQLFELVFDGNAYDEIPVRPIDPDVLEYPGPRPAEETQRALGPADGGRDSDLRPWNGTQ